ncbi:MAG: hypothetical protein Q9190_007527 [Brigantiaea leucoxantha]
MASGPSVRGLETQGSSGRVYDLDEEGNIMGDDSLDQGTAPEPPVLGGEPSSTHTAGTEGLPGSQSADGGGEVPQELAELRAWFKQNQYQAELDQLRELKDKASRGDNINFLAGSTAMSKSLRAATNPLEALGDTKLPEPEKPAPYTAKSRLEYDEWVRKNETFHRRSYKLQSEDAKVYFSQQYLDSTLGRAWFSYVEDQQARDNHWEPTWAILKQEMLKRLGPSWERAQKAWDLLKRTRQDGREPVDLLNHLRPLWVEAGLNEPSLQIKSFISSLDTPVYTKVMYDYVDPCMTLEEAENRATRATRQQVKAPGPQRGKEKGEAKPNTPPQAASSQAGSSKSHPKPSQPKRPEKRGRGGKETTETPSKKQKKAETELTCYACSGPGHIAPNCPDEAKKEAYYKAKKAKAAKASTGAS